jgi:putative flippase GtrA
VRGILLQALRFLAVGGGATIVHVGTALFFNAVVGLSPLTANFCGFLLGWSVSYLGHWRWTFSAASAHRSAVPRFFIVSIVLVALNQAIVYAVTVRLGWPFWTALAIVVAVIPAGSFLASRLWAFLPARTDGEGGP